MNKMFKFFGILFLIALLAIGVAMLLPLLIKGDLDIGILTLPKTGTVALLPIEGVITTTGGIQIGLGISSAVSSSEIISALEAIEKNPSIVGVILKIDSSGGTPVAGMEIAEKVASFKKPVLAWIREVGASAAYIIASSADKIFAHNFSMVGGLGVTGSYLEYSDLFEKYGVNYIRIVSGEHKDMGTPYREPTAEELQIYNELILKLNRDVNNFITSRRSLSAEYLQNITDGRVFLGDEALKIGLVDYIGSKDDMLDVMENLTNSTKVIVSEYTKGASIFDFLSSIGGEIKKHFLNLIGLGEINGYEDSSSVRMY